MATSTSATTALQTQLKTLEIGALVSGVFVFVNNIVSASVLSAEIKKCFQF